jgi:hypothetical protein
MPASTSIPTCCTPGSALGPGPPDQGRQLRTGKRHHAARLLDKLARGEESLRAVTLVEGWNFRQVRAALAKSDQLKPTRSRWTDAT